MKTETTMSVLRRKAGLSQADIAEKLGMSQANVSRFESLDRLPFHVLDQIHAMILTALGPEQMRGIIPADLALPWEDVVIRNYNAKSGG